MVEAYILARVTWVETLSAFTRLHRESKIDSKVLTQTIDVFMTDWESQFQIVELEKLDYKKAGDLLKIYLYVPKTAFNWRVHLKFILFLLKLPHKHLHSSPQMIA